MPHPSLASRMVLIALATFLSVQKIHAKPNRSSLLRIHPAAAFLKHKDAATTFGGRQSPSDRNGRSKKESGRATASTNKNYAELVLANTMMSVRGGACSDADATVFVKVGMSAALETMILLAVFYAGKEVAENWSGIPTLSGLPASHWISILLVVFGSSFFGSFVDGGMSVATQQALDPNVIPGDPNWYNKLNKPSWNPPGWVFPIMWLIVSKPTQVVALSKLIKAKETIPWQVLAVYCAHLSLGDAWNKVFFGYQCIGKGVAVITVFFGLLLSSAFLFSGVDPTAGKFLLPTCGWVLVATSLNWNIYLNN